MAAHRSDSVRLIACGNFVLVRCEGGQDFALLTCRHLGEIKAAEGVELLGNKSTPVISVALPKTEAEEAAATEAAPTGAGEVEMIKEKKEEGAEGAAPAKGDKGAPAKADAKAGAAPAKDAKAAAPAKK